jgi:uncharacterized protein YyaL (SSP411 family)
VRLVATPGTDATLSPLLEGRVGAGAPGEPRVYVCEGTVCEQPATTPEQLRAQLT